MKRNGVYKTCPVCKSEFYVKKRDLKETNTCSFECSRTLLRKARQKQIEDRFGMPIKDIINYFYHDRQLGVKQVANSIGVSDRVLWDWMEDFCIKRREKSEAVSLQWRDNDQRKLIAAKSMKELIQKGSINNQGENNPAKTPAARQKISQSKQGSKNAMYGKFGDLNTNWKGGKVTYRGKGWRGIRAQIIRRDKNKCRLCDSTVQLEVHHITPYRTTKDNSPENLITLCKLCHSGVEYGKIKLTNL